VPQYINPKNCYWDTAGFLPPACLSNLCKALTFKTFFVLIYLSQVNGENLRTCELSKSGCKIR